MEQSLKENIHKIVLDLQFEDDFSPGFEFQIYQNYEQAKKAFRASYKAYNCAMSIYNLDEHATEYIEIMKDLQNLYSNSLVLETEFDRKESINYRKCELLEPLLKILNPQHYMARLVELHVIMAETQACLFELYHSVFIKNGKKHKKMNKSGKKSISSWEFVGEYMRKEKQDNSQSYINCQYNIGRIYSKLKAKTNSELKVTDLIHRAIYYLHYLLIKMSKIQLTKLEKNKKQLTMN